MSEQGSGPPTQASTTRVMFGCGAGLFTAEAIEHEGMLWLVPRWLEHSIEAWRTPARMIRLPRGLLDPAPAGYPFDLALRPPLPQSAIDGSVEAAQAEGWLVLEAPDIRVPKPTRLH